jgi:hypothetical protein
MHAVDRRHPEPIGPSKAATGSDTTPRSVCSLTVRRLVDAPVKLPVRVHSIGELADRRRTCVYLSAVPPEL